MSNLTDLEFCTLLRFNLNRPFSEPRVEELLNRLEDAAERIEGTDRNLRALQAKYGVTDEDMVECEGAYGDNA
jgi:hypothetical protein